MAVLLGLVMVLIVITYVSLRAYLHYHKAHEHGGEIKKLK